MTTTSDMARLLMMQGTQVPDAGLGPVTNTTRAGRPNPMLTAPPNQERPADYMQPVAELLSLPMGAYGAGQLVGSGINAAREGDYASGAGQVALGMAGMLPMAPKGGKGIRAFHGSPHDFERFDMSKIGTGEGAQAYGHGLYFAEAEDVARSYRDALAADNMKVAGNKIIPRNYAINTIVQKYRDDLPLLEEKLRTYAADETNNPYAYTEDAISIADSIKRGDFSGDVPGHMYEVNIRADPQDFLDWDKPLSQQSEAVRANVEALAQQALERQVASDRVQASKARQMGLSYTPRDISIESMTGAELARLPGIESTGIPGIRYLDQMSRDFTPPKIKETADGFEVYWGNDPRPVDTFKTRAQAEEVARQFDTRSSNYVVFDDSLIEILRKYGLLGPVAGGGTLAGMLMGGQGVDTY